MQRIIDPFSLRLRLTIAVTALSTLVLGSLIAWTASKMQRILIDTQKHDIEQIATRFPRDVQIYSEMMEPEAGLQKAIDRQSDTELILWVKNSQGQIQAKSMSLESLPSSLANKLVDFPIIFIKPTVYKVGQVYFVLAATPLRVKSKPLGKLFLAQDITNEKAMIDSMVRSLALIGFLTIALMTLAIAFYISYSLKPLRKLNQMTANISTDNLGQTQIFIEQAPSEVKELAITLSHLLSRLSLSWEREQQFTSNVSHELRTPLTIVYGYLQSVLRRGHNLTQMQQEALKTATSEAERTIHILQDLLDLARGDSGYLPLKMESVNLKDLITEVVNMSQKSSDRQITIASEADTTESMIDSGRFQQVLINLLDNAIKYSQPGTPIQLKLSQHQERAIIQVIDQGYGIPLQHQARIFERFYRVDESRNQTTGGCGLGLSIVKMLVEGMGGNISLESKLGYGSTFTISLPASKPKSL